jgi:hypothetical protein
MISDRVPKNKDHEPYDCPQNALQLHDEIIVFLLQAMLLYELGEFSEMTFLLQYLAAQFCLGHLAVEVRRYRAVEGPGPVSVTAKGFWEIN